MEGPPAAEGARGVEAYPVIREADGEIARRAVDRLTLEREEEAVLASRVEREEALGRADRPGAQLHLREDDHRPCIGTRVDLDA